MRAYAFANGSREKEVRQFQYGECSSVGSTSNQMLTTVNCGVCQHLVTPVAQLSLFYTRVAAMHCRHTGVSYLMTMPSLMCWAPTIRLHKKTLRYSGGAR